MAEVREILAWLEREGSWDAAAGNVRFGLGLPMDVFGADGRRAVSMSGDTVARLHSHPALSTMTTLDLSSLLAFNVVLLAAIASPGPALLFAMRATLAGGRWSGIMAGIGLASIAAGWTLAALLGLDAIFRLVPWAYGALKLAGAIYLLHIAWRTWRSARQPIATGGASIRRAFRDGVVINLANPKAVLFAASVIVVLFPEGLGALEIAVITLNHLLLELVVYALLACVLASPPVARGYLKLKHWLDRACAALLAALGLRLLFDQR